MKEKKLYVQPAIRAAFLHVTNHLLVGSTEIVSERNDYIDGGDADWSRAYHDLDEMELNEQLY